MIAVARFTTDVDVVDIVRRISAAYPGTATVSDDYYRDRIASAEALATEIGYDQNSRPLQCLRDVASRVGLQYHLRIPLTRNTWVDARIDGKGALVTGDGGIPDSLRIKLLDLLAAIPATIDTD
ncbi:hypothetical protein RISK_004734 [Rhodopirellula islandica]|uniref:Uncharacterized protein n=1 Tax=Rhodopirellula islandica TaxID=595434 RepID=A0A0J1B9N0_RHOIS|nr:hypothetical protein [Rhodopirellula islandica]KLU03422.1 hypothetical protein RISK_004734 [Rhodopirellula islandica]